MSTFFTSDTHFGHRGIIKWAKRPFGNTKDMDAELIRRWNTTISQEDTVFHLGDFGFHSTAEQLNPILSQLNGTIHLVIGNHDKNPNIENFAYWRIQTFDDYLEVTIENQRIILCHYPLREWNDSFKGSWHLYGHAHNQWPQSRWKRLDVGVDGHDLRPWSMDELRIIMNKRRVMTSEIYR